VAALRRIASAAAVLGYLVVALMPCSPGEAVARQEISQGSQHAGHAAEANAGTPPPCHGPQLILQAPCACGCGERATAAPSAKLGAPLPAWTPRLDGEGLPQRHACASQYVGEPDVEGVDSVPRLA
jgi:hypothetical protein